MSKLMFNECLICEDTTSSKQSTDSGFSLDNQQRFKKVKVVHTTHPKLEAGDDVLVPSAAGERDPYNEDHIILRHADLIYKF